jgi:hypothetical protein
LVDKETHEARGTAHKVLDELWKLNITKRSEAYALLSEELGISRSACHMKEMDFYTASRVPKAVENIKARLLGEIDTQYQLPLYQRRTHNG